ncbi:MAG TPA: VWA domain-containing protein [Vicinamibacteria bacterium]|nr:VWA domain-containing protein [Vicinamibacteria bacterium]
MSALILAVFLLGQAAPATAPGTEIRALTVTLLGEKDQEVTDISAADIALAENGVSRDITSFKPDRRPLSVAIIVDTSLAMGASYRLNVVDAVVGFVARLPEGARYALWTTGDRPTKVVDHTDDRQAAGDALRRVAPQGGNTMLDAFAEASVDLKKLSREGDRTVVVAVTGTGPELSYRDKYRAVEEAEKNAELFLSVQIDSGEADFEMRSNLSYVMDRLARSTGGRYEVVLSAMGTDTALRKLSAHLRSGYRLAYATLPDLKKRKLDLSIARPGTEVFLPIASTREASSGEP